MKILVMFFLLGCAPSFTTQLCVEECSKCRISICEEVCGDLKRGMDSADCSTASNEVWYCALDKGCGFVEDCSNEIDNFLMCQEDNGL